MQAKVTELAKTELEAAGEDTSGMVESVSKLREQVIALSGVDILEADEKTFKSTTQIVRELSQVYDQMQDIDQASLLELLAGKRGANVLAAALQNFDIVEDTIKGATTESVDSMDKQLEVYNQSIQASLDKFHVAFQELSADILNSDLIKGIVDAGTMILKIIDELVKHIGVLGTALTGLGIAKIFTTATNGAKSVTGWGNVLSTVFAELATNTTTATESMTAMQIVLTALKSKATGAGSAVSGMLSGLGAFLTSPVALGVAAVGAVVGAGVLAYKAYKKQQEELIKQATATTKSWDESQTKIDEYKQKYIDLNEQLQNSNLSESEKINIKQQLLSLQNEITAKYGEQAKGIDLINGGLETQLGILSNITAEEASRNIRDNREAYEFAEKEMTRQRTFKVNNGDLEYISQSGLQSQIVQAFKNADFEKTTVGFKFTGDAEEFEKAAEKVFKELDKLKDEALLSSDRDIIDGITSNLDKVYKKNDETLQKHRNNYKAYIEQQLYKEGFGDELAEYAKRTQEYNDALFSGDAEKINEAKQRLDEYKGTVKEITDAHSEYGDFFDEVANSVDKTTEKVYQFSDIIKDGVADSSNDLKAYESQIKTSVNNLKTLGLDGVDVQDILLHGGNGFEDLSALAKLFNPDIDLSNEDQVKTFADVLAQLGVVAGGAGDGIDLAKDSFDGFMKSASASIDTLDKVNASLVNSFKSGGLSARIDAETGELTGDVQTILSAYKKELGDGSIDQLFERTADGIMVNRDALRALQAEQENTTKAEFIERIKEAEANLAAATTDEERRAWQTRLDNVKLLASAYDGATSAYQKWVDAQSMGEAGDQYDTIASTALKRGKELYDKGLVGTNEFRAIAQLYSDQDLALASVEELTEAYENGVGTVKKYFTEGQEGAVAFADKMVELGVATKEGDFYNFGEGIDTSQIADELDISVDLVEAAFKKLGDYGFDIHFMSEDQLAEFDTLTEKAEEAQDKLKELRDSGASVGDSDLIDIDLSEIDTVDEMKSALDQLNEVVASPEIDPESAEAYQAIIDALQEKLDLLSQTDIGNEVNFDNLDSAYSLLGSLQGRMAQIDSLNATSTVDIDVMGDDQVQLVAEQIANLPPEIKKAIGFEVEDDATAVIEKLKKEEVQIPVEYQQPTNVPTATGGTATVNVKYEQGDLPTVSSQTVHLDYEPNPINANVVTALDKTAVDSYKPEDKDAKVIFGKDSSNPDNYQPSDKYATVNYSVSVSGASAVDNLPDSGNRYITYYINTVGSIPGNYKGTVSKSAFQGISHANGTAHANGLSRYGLKQDENSLVNELGAEIVVRPSEDSWMIFNDGMPTFAQLRKGDVIFDAEQTKELLSKGWTKNSASIFGSSFVGGTAHARKVVGGGSFKKATSSSKSSSGSGGGGGNDSGGGGGDNSKANKEANDFKETLDKIEIRIDRLDRLISNFDTVASNVFNNLTTRSDALSKSLYVVGTEIKEQERAYTRYIKQANKVGLDSKLAAKVRKGEIDIQDIKNEDTWKKIEEYRKWYEAALDARDAVYKLKADEADLWNQRFELNQTNYENQIDQYQHMYDQLDNYISLAESTGRISANKLRLRQIDEEKKKLSKLKTEYNSLKAIMDKAVASGKIKINSEGYYEMLSTLNDISESIVEATANIAELNKSIRETNWEIFDRGAETISNVRDELEFLYGLLGDEDNMYDDKGVVTKDGIAGFGILSAQYNVAMQEAQKYASEIKKINKEISKDPYNQDLIDRRQELYESQRQSIEDANNYKDSIVDLVENGIKKQIDSLKELISKYTDLMDAQKDEIDYAKRVADAQANINKIQKQLNAYANDDTEEGASRRQKLRNDLKNAQDNLAQTEEDRRISQTKKLLSDLQEEYENILNARFDDVDALIQAVIDGVNVNSSTIVDAIRTASNEVGYIMTDATSTIFNSSTVKDLASYFVNGGFVETVTGIADSVNLITSYYSSAQKNADQKAQANIMAEKVRSTGHMQTYTDSSGKTRTGYFKDDGTLDTSFTGWVNKGGKYYRFSNGQMMSGSQWVNVGGKKYYLDADGSRATNTWRSVGGNLYRFNQNGEALTGLQTINNQQFYFDSSGVNKKGLQTVNGSKYYFNTDNGAMVKNAWRQVGDGLYYFGANGKAASGWMQTDSGLWFFFDPKTNKKVVSQWIHNNTITTKPVKGDYYVGADGIRVTNGKKKTNRGMLTFDANGKWKGYKSGVRSVPSDGLYWTNEGAPETIIRKSDGAILTRLNTNDTVLNNNATQNMWDFANNPQKFLRGLGVSNTYGSGNNVNLEFNLSGLRSPSEFMDALRKDKRFEKLIQEMTLGRINGHGSLAKNAIRV